ncbi:TonB-dependent receptor (plasmid) [Pedobacter sp. BS3]|uniref:SusC/RagA family TonB-linked outer membrane protein n=1 Tax=Pedobacter sp. BS3 TaxID=2567937 RepID=UPI0011EF0E95|nr:TonB-dependent receptor [Pedobacter sp. BS3]TZF86279.1 TonB-dependent receptor [Pedobacter sp. BS3]
MLHLYVNYFVQKLRIPTFLWLSICLFIVLCLCTGIQTAVAQNQQNSISGQVTDEQGEALPGVSVTLKGGRIAAVTDNKGNYNIAGVPANAILVFSYLGFQPVERSAGVGKVINVVLKMKSTSLDEIVVIGYGTVKKGDVTGSVGQVNIQDMEKAPVISFDQALAGRIAGVDVSSDEGQPGEEGTNIVIRGGNSLTQDNSPLYVVDGFPMESPDNAAINPDDIESITVLKDASATAIYGARGANGVIVIETKKGKAGQPVINYSGSFGFQKVTKTMDMMSPYEFVKYQHELNPSAAETRYGTDLELYKNVKGYDWQDQIFHTAPTQIHNLSLRGGNAQTKYSVSGSIYNMEGVIINSGQKRYQGRAVLDQVINKRLKAGININYSSTTNHGQIASSGGSASSSYMYSVWGYRPITIGAIDDDDQDLNLEDELTDDVVDGSTDTRVNPIISAKNELRRRRSSTSNFNAYVTYNITPELTFKATGGLNLWMRRNDSFNNSQTSHGTPLLPRNIRGVNGSVGYTESNTWLNENTLTWKKTFNKQHSLDAVAGFTMQGNHSEGYGYNSQLISNEVLGMSGLDTGTPYNSTASISDNGLVSFLGRVNYSYKSKYLLTASFRADGSSKFPPQNRWGYFPSAAFAWRMKNEPFLKSSRVIYDSKLRFSYGLTGNNRVSDFAPLPALGQSYSYYYSFNNATPTPGITPTNMGNANLKWESTLQADLGYDISLFKSRVELTIDAYRKTTYDLLLNADLPFATGFSSVYQNIGKIRNQGLEFTLNTVNIRNRNFRWESNFNISFNNNKILELVDNQQNKLSTMTWESAWNSVPLYIAEVGGPAAMFYGYVWDGVYQTSDFEDGVLKKDMAYYGTDRGLIQPGDTKYKDLNGDGVITTADQTLIGRTLPIHSGGFSNNFSYKGFNLNIFFQWKYGNDVYNANRIIFEGNVLNRYNLNQYASYVNRWEPDNPSNTLFRTGGRGPTGYYSSREVEDGSYLRLKTVQLSYDVPARYSKLITAKNLSFNVTAQNLFTWTDYSGMDPEVAVRNTTLTPGFDYSAYPRARTIVFGVKATF